MSKLLDKLSYEVESIGLGLRDIAFPSVCGVCSHRLNSGIDHVCLSCRATLTVLDLHTIPQNTMTDRFWGRLPIVRAAALLPYTPEAPAVRIMQLLKYDDRPQLGYNLGSWFGRLLAESKVFGEVDLVVPVPLHPKKFRIRGYNQAERIARGIADVMEAQCLPYLVERRRHTQTQTRMSKFERMVNVDDVFQLAGTSASGAAPRYAKNLIQGRSILLVDDVMTTGATLESLGKAILPAEPGELKVATLALARH